MPAAIVWSARSHTGRVYGDALGIWRDEVADVSGGPIDCGHYVREERPTRRCNGSCGTSGRDEGLTATCSLHWRRPGANILPAVRNGPHRQNQGRIACAVAPALWHFSVAIGLALSLSTVRAAPFMIVGNDEKVLWDDQGKPIMSLPGKDSVLILDLADPLNPKIVANLSLENSVVGPPVNLDIAPDGSIALVADSVTIVKEGDALKQVLNDKIWVIDLKANPPKLAGTVIGAKQPSGLSFSPSGDIALVANRADKSISVLSIKGTDVKVIDTVAMGDEVSQVVFTPDGKRALATKFAAHKVALLEVNGDKVTYTKTDVTVGLWPYNVVVSPDGKIALTADNGGAGSSDGNVDTVSIIDLELKPPRVIDKVVVGDGPEGLAMSPKGNVAVAAILAGSNNKAAFFHRDKGYVSVLRVDGKKVTKIKEFDVGGLPEAAVFTPDGRYLMVGNYLDQDFSILKVDGTDVTDTGKRFKVPGHPASARMSLH